MRYYAKIVKTFKAGEMVFREKDACDGMYLIDSGRVRVFKTVGTGNDKREVDLCVLGHKSMFGEMAMIDEERRSANVQAIEPTSCTVITKKIFEDQLNRIPPWMVNLIKILVQRLRETNETLRALAEKGTPAPASAVPERPIKPTLVIESMAAEQAPQKTNSATIIFPPRPEVADETAKPLDALEPAKTELPINFSEDVLHSLFRQYEQSQSDAAPPQE
jgi:CRP-like cAMP-binding protein